jgi:hypothetical protein
VLFHCHSFFESKKSSARWAFIIEISVQKLKITNPKKDDHLLHCACDALGSMQKYLKCNTFNCHQCSSYSTEDTQLKMTKQQCGICRNMLQEAKSSKKEQKTHENAPLLLVTLRMLTWCMRNHHHLTWNVDISRSRVACLPL